MEKDTGKGAKRRLHKGSPGGGEGRKKKAGDADTRVPTVRTPEEKHRRQCVCPKIPPRVRLVCCRVLDNRVVEVTLMLLTFYALFGDDVRRLATSRTADPVFDAFTSVALLAFGLEIVLSAIGKKDYLFHLFFYLDVVSLLSLVLDLSSVDEAMHVWAEEGSSATEGDVSQAALAGKAGSKVARMLRLIRLVRLIRVAKLYKNIGFSSAPQQDDEFREFDSFLEPEAIDLDDLKEAPAASKRGETSENAAEEFQSEVGKKLTEKTTRKIVFVVLALTLIIPVLSEETIVTKFASEKSGLELVAEYATAARRGERQESWLRVYTHATLFYMNYHRRGGIGDSGGNSSHLAFFQLALPLYQTTMLDGRIYQDIPCTGFASCANSLVLPPEAAARLYLPEAVSKGALIVDDLDSVDDLRLSEREVYTAYFCNAASADSAVGGSPKATDCDLDKVTQIRAVFDRRSASKIEAGLSILRTFIVCFLLIVGAVLVTRDENKLVLVPIERMMGKMKEIQNNPLAAANMSDDAPLDGTSKKLHDAHRRALEEEEASSPFRVLQAIFSDKGKGGAESMETAMLEKTIIKIGGLLALGFGEAGAEIIAKNMKNADGGLNAMLDGKKLQAVFGFCDIRNFTDATEILKEKVMVFVNQIAEIVHGTVDQYSGCANKNIGDAFLLVWKFPEVEREGGVKEQLMDTATTNRLADMALVSFVKIIAEINKSQVLAEYRDIPELIERLGTGWKVKMGFGLHVGWAIEGAIGSEYKIDASYLSPNVNMASRLEAATKQYGVYILISNELYDIMSPQAQLNCRQIDRATVKGSQVPLGLYTVDLDPGRLSVVRHPLGTGGGAQNKSRLRQQRTLQKQKLWSSRTSISALFETDPDIVTMREHLTKEFLTTFRRGFCHYQAGEWHRAREIFVKTQFMLGVEDVPSSVLLSFMAGHGFVAPADWMGFRELVEK
ncbi:adenylate and guanylate cyclase catalytic domain-containing protein [Toxoplasma gondii ME49]|uniref:Adenylate and guanylate cyclase catalytic domain-containing protein n=2 Tax=Toxoplasma gondii TaxID=5811 RepID=S8F365_TOXGM|nr:adenylate and guanylate cyclase catalytic domain-containing protein [Toxoplasma gondii ME49]EPT27918.1 adenylate and guanylate cyclase catalytic domain-containing protein [Toxoplasma gondii ME49]KYF45183.1 adenylate and guanylate cyclase catalytic domain-containing protein [Toxoplasma gondii ARI]|eukprot:XP_002368352.1 adenylate and guanylate cyclase catalytic domain-containing protein [Toxoplasma gondii ME49]